MPIERRQRIAAGRNHLQSEQFAEQRPERRLDLENNLNSAPGRQRRVAGELDAIAHQVERQLQSLGDNVAAHERARAEMLVADARQAVKDSAPLDQVRSLTGELQQIYHALVAVPAGGAAPSRSGGNGSTGGATGDDDVIDADFTVS